METPTFIAFFERLGADPARAEDLTQDVFLRLVRGVDHYVARDTFAAYALRVARNVWFDLGRRAIVRGATAADDTLDALAAEIDSRLGAPSHALELSEEGARARAALAQLTDGQRLVFELAVLQSRPYPEIARIVGIPLGTVKSRMFTAVRRLRELLESSPERSR